MLVFCVAHRVVLFACFVCFDDVVCCFFCFSIVCVLCRQFSCENDVMDVVE